MHNLLVKKLEASMGSPFLAATLPHHEAKRSDDALETWRKPIEKTLRKACDYLRDDECERVSHYIAREVMAELVAQLNDALTERDEQRARAQVCEARHADTQARMLALKEGIIPLLGQLLPSDA